MIVKFKDEYKEILNLRLYEAVGKLIITVKSETGKLEYYSLYWRENQLPEYKNGYIDLSEYRFNQFSEYCGKLGRI